MHLNPITNQKILKKETNIAKKLTIDKDLCEGCETCISPCPEVYAMGDDCKAYVINPDACNTCDCQEAIDSSPVGAISWE